ncbi:hypothetical protein [Halorussus sp. MSC15.2]|uniref:hypothetical protein n=1 Tax=Halorussus sp. MSC15.2 TaxID=2283638 RepID=UPI0013D041F5|nr:hypothetical protein [Halorussus sp. MSC15.2]NEU58025.1 hypothetical protein [Halorussus sp. MSC15.2]
MKRRTYLASSATFTASAGCLGRIAATNDFSTKQTQKTVSVTNVGTKGAPEGLDLHVAVHDPTITEDSTARMSLKYTNIGENTLSLNINPDAPDPVFSVEDSPGLLLLSDAYDPRQTSPGCWKPKQDQFVQPGVVHNYRLEPGQTATLTYDVWANPTQDGCIQPGDYRLELLYGSTTLTVARR